MKHLARMKGLRFLAIVAILALGAIPVLAEGQAKAPAKPARPAAVAKPAGPVNINTATVDELRSLPKIGPAIAAEIVKYREQNGKFKKVEDIMNVKGIGEKTFLLLKDQLTVGEPAAKG